MGSVNTLDSAKTDDHLVEEFHREAEVRHAIKYIYHSRTYIISKYEAMVNEAAYQGGDKYLVKRAEFCKVVLQLVGIIKQVQTQSYFRLP
jgi:hypothetical protein